MPEMTYREALSLALREELRRRDCFFLMGEDIGAYGGSYAVTKGFLEEFGERRVKDTPISESAIVGLAIGAAMLGACPMIELMTINFSLLAMDQIVNHAAKIHYMSGGQVAVPLVLRMPTGGGFQLGAQHSQNLEGWFAHVPGLKVVTPSTPYDAKGLLKAAINDGNPVIFVEHSLLYGMRGEVPEEEYVVPLGQAAIRREGTDLTLIAYSRMAHVALEAADKLAARGISAEVVDLRSLRPLDVDALVRSVQKTNRALVVEEAPKSGGFGGEVVATISDQAFDFLDAPVGWVGGADVPMPYTRPLEALAIPDADKVVAGVQRMMPGRFR